MKVAIVSSCYGSYDTPRPPVQQDTYHDVEYIMVTDGAQEWPGWTNVVEPRPHLHPNVAAKIAKTRPDFYTKAGYTVWIDAGAFISSQFLTAFLPAEGEDWDVWSKWRMFPHPYRTSLSDEVSVSRMMRKYDPLPMEHQVDHYKKVGYPDTELWSTGVIGRMRSEEARNHGDLWLDEIVRWGFQDQLSFTFVKWASGIPVFPMLGRRSDIIDFQTHTEKIW